MSAKALAIPLPDFIEDTVSGQTEETNPYVKAVNRITDTVVFRLTRPILLWDFVFYMTGTGRQFKKDCDFVHSVAEKVIDKRKETLVRAAIVTEKRFVDFLDILLTARDETWNGLTRIEIRDEVDTFLVEVSIQAELRMLLW
ncbi:cytochrome P450 4F6-like [Dreissena polymorpha]|uniref:cytochrome P450 4F6-like n=1 Tax=Dreissena polymorpha TaxID=45954 RepID=UPI002263C111|nr:cytochrome P450 4F6-like [Dreissena polymorpha]